MSKLEFDKFRVTEILDNETEFIPLLSSEDEERMNQEEHPNELPILPLRNNVLFPGVVIPITVGRDKSIKLIKEAYRGSKTIAVVAQKDLQIEDPGSEDIYYVGTIAHILKILQMPDGTTTTIIQGKRRFQLDEITETNPYLKGHISADSAVKFEGDKHTFDALIESLKDLAQQIIQNSPHVPSEASFAIKNIESSTFLINFIASNLNVDTQEKQNLLEITDIFERAKQVLKSLTRELQIIDLKNQIQNKVKTDLDKQQRDYFLSQQLKTIQDELGNNPHEQEIKDLQGKAASNSWNKDVKEIFDREITKLQRMNPQAMEYSIQLNYLELLVDLPWGKYSQDNFDLNFAQKVLDKDHYGLDKIKHRVIEYLAVLKLKGDMKSPILCLVGPPGVGKTSLGKSIARATGRKYIRMSLGGLRDESEIRGHRKTYIGAMPGRIIQNLRKAKSANPVFVLDEIDKIIGANVSGDPASALLEVLDPEQNGTFYDNFLEVEFDLSKVMFIATANTLSTIHPALLDRMEVIDISGYLLEEKLEIAKRHLIPKQLSEHGVKKTQLAFTKAVVEKIVDDYTRESGVRRLEKNLAKIIRNRAKYIAMDEEYNKKVSLSDVESIMGPAVFQKERSLDNNLSGVVTGLAWTAVGGEILFVECSLSSGKGVLTLTGNLGDVMKESATLAFQYLKAHAKELNINQKMIESTDVHIHVPEGATPKDGPSAGITMFTALASAFTKRKIKAKLAMTGEITLRGRVTPVGGIKEKILAAKRANIKEIILSEDNRKNIEDIDPNYIKGVTFHYVTEMMQAIELALI